MLLQGMFRKLIYRKESVVLLLILNYHHAAFPIYSVYCLVTVDTEATLANLKYQSNHKKQQMFFFMNREEI